jgi:hypothetical protein
MTEIEIYKMSIKSIKGCGLDGSIVRIAVWVSRLLYVLYRIKVLDKMDIEFILDN